FAIAAILGFELITKVPPTLHTPLMSGSNAISGVTVVGALYCLGAGDSELARWCGLIALIAATINVVGGFIVTDRMLSAFKKKEAR
ncbi:MAG: NAD(P) transhydrogenase subunit alpha, partial [Myxococcota bacterium]